MADDELTFLKNIVPSDIPVPDIPVFSRKQMLVEDHLDNLFDKPINEGNEAVIGAITNYGWSDIAPWYNSLIATGYNGKIFLLVYNATYEAIKEIHTKANRIHIIALGQRNDKTQALEYEKSDFNVCVDRFYHLWKFLSLNNFDNVLTTDVKDVVFQRNPMELIRNYEKGIIVTSESITYENEEWGQMNMKLSFGQEMYEHMKDRTIHNAGVVAGRGKILSDFFLKIYLMCRGLPARIPGGGGPDQAALNLLLSLEPYASCAEFVPTYDLLACQAGTTNDPRKKHYQLLIPARPEFVQSEVCYPGEGIYYIVHQYDRVPEWREYFMEKFGNG